MKSFQNSVWENKIIFFISLIPYAIILFIAIYYGGIVGFQWMDTWCDGFYGFIGALEIIGLLLIGTPVGLIILLCIIYHICWIINFCKKRKKSNKGNC